LKNWRLGCDAVTTAHALKAALKDPDLVKRFGDISTDPMPEARATPEVAERTLNSEIDRWAPIIKAAGQYAD
jgi:tripartite-type tricarboxylate transporter receptor subunit TctC